jgi:hypothetical protein
MHAVLRFEEAVRVIAGDGQRRALDARFFGERLFIDLDLPALALREADQHAHEHHRPVRRVDAAGARGDLEDRAARIELARQHATELHVVERLADRRHGLLRFFRGCFVGHLFGELEQRLGIRERTDLVVVRTDDLLELLLVAEQALRLLLIVPEVRARCDGVELFDLQTLRIDVKVTSGARRPWSPAPSAAPSLRGYRQFRSPWRGQS